ncbi:MAG TPA: VWA domain-containing protein [Burkholderiaceae bacterium]|nr:VWA domain-containing protein [Burkholderiaceae bacterium]HQR71065.1 VWA domain-containing protein [Burkholderiaceae bacterium]
MESFALSFLWPRLLWLLLALPLAMLVYRALVWRRRAASQPLVNLDIVGAEAAARWRRAVPPLLWLLALTALLLAVARPQATITLPSRVETVILALDMSGSMKATDIAPTRMAAARDAAVAFVNEQPDTVRIGVVGIAAAAAVVQSPTTKREDILSALERLEPQRGTALGSGLVIALDTAMPQAHIDVDGFINPRKDRPKPIEAAQGDDAKSMAPGENTSVAIVLLSDGQSNVGPDPQKAAELAARYGVRIYTVGMGTPEGVIVRVDGWSMRTRLDEDALQKVASTTHGEYFRATDAKDLKKIYRTLGAKLAFEKQRPTEVTAVFAGIGALLATLAALLSMLWFNRIL